MVLSQVATRLMMMFEMDFSFCSVLCEEGECILDDCEVRCCGDDSSLHFAECALVVEVARQERIPASLNCFVQCVLR